MKTISLHIAVIEDDQFYSSMLSHQIEKYGPYQVQVYYSISAFEKDEPEKFDLIISDYYLSDQDNGGVLINRLKIKKINTPVIFLSGQESLENTLELLKGGAIDYIEKDDTTFEKLRHALIQFSRWHKIDRELKKQKKKNKKERLLYGVLLAATVIALYFISF